MKYSYPGIMEVDEANPDYINIKIPDIWGAETFGIGEEHAIAKAADLLVQMLLFQSNQCGEPHSLEEAQKAFPTKKVVMIEVEF